MKETVIRFETAVLAKELGIILETEKYWCNYYEGQPWNKWKLLPKEQVSLSFMEYSAPTQSLLQKYLREVYGIFVYVDETGRPRIRDEKSNMLAEVCNNGKYAGFEYEDALEKGLIEGLKVAGKRK